MMLRLAGPIGYEHL